METFMMIRASSVGHADDDGDDKSQYGETVHIDDEDEDNQATPPSSPPPPARAGGGTFSSQLPRRASDLLFRRPSELMGLKRASEVFSTITGQHHHHQAPLSSSSSLPSSPLSGSRNNSFRSFGSSLLDAASALHVNSSSSNSQPKATANPLFGQRIPE